MFYFLDIIKDLIIFVNYKKSHKINLTSVFFTFIISYFYIKLVGYLVKL